jgi:hypothetical protein
MFFTNIFIKPNCIYTVDGSVEGNFFFAIFDHKWCKDFCQGHLFLSQSSMESPCATISHSYYPFQYARQFNCYMSLTALENIDVIHPIKLTMKYEKLPLVCLTFIL